MPGPIRNSGKCAEKSQLHRKLGRAKRRNSIYGFKMPNLPQDIVFMDLVQGRIRPFSSVGERYIGEQKAKLGGFVACDRLTAAGDQL